MIPGILLNPSLCANTGEMEGGVLIPQPTVARLFILSINCVFEFSQVYTPISALYALILSSAGMPRKAVWHILSTFPAAAETWASFVRSSVAISRLESRFRGSLERR